ncbi:duodenase-1-like [Melanotaenia boesemani]|uniref:duodenase-1-like n=1 Tax=Melanotaenia boesemani TaxID=1250792 RepID=UPI001C05C885|nr:duodenase-1-like [Melanotaenia boesemani]
MAICVEDFSSLGILWSQLHTVGEKDNYLKRGIEERYIHPGYTSPGFGFDIMLLKLSVEVDINERIHTIKIPASKMNVKENQTCSVAGWGMTQTTGSVVNELRVVNVSIIDPESCKEEWTALPPNVICAGGSGTDKGFCQGDSGDPLVCNDIAVSIVSFNRNSNCSYPDVPNVYTDISEYVPWINKIVTDNWTNEIVKDTRICTPLDSRISSALDCPTNSIRSAFSMRFLREIPGHLFEA